MRNLKRQSANTFDCETEETDIGQQYLISCVAPVTQKQRLEFLATLPMTPKRARQQKLCDIGLFDEVSRNQLDLF